MNDKIRILIAEDHVVLREGCVTFLNQDNNLTIIGEAGNGLEVLHLLRKSDPEPDILILDVEMPLMNGYETAEHVLKVYPKVKIIILSMHMDSALVTEFFRLGISAYLPKECSLYKLAEVVKLVHRDGLFLDAKTKTLIEYGYNYTFKRNIMIEQKALEKTEIAVLKNICKGRKGKEIAEELNISIDTVDFYKRKIKTKTKLNTMPELILYAIKHGYVSIFDENL